MGLPEFPSAKMTNDKVGSALEWMHVERFAFRHISAVRYVCVNMTYLVLLSNSTCKITISYVSTNIVTAFYVTIVISITNAPIFYWNKDEMFFIADEMRFSFKQMLRFDVVYPYDVPGYMYGKRYHA